MKRNPYDADYPTDDDPVSAEDAEDLACLSAAFAGLLP